MRALLGGRRRVVQLRLDDRQQVSAKLDQRQQTATHAGLRVTGDWADEIRRAWAQGTGHTLELARVVHAARSSLLRGEWVQLWRSGEEMPFSRRTAQYLLAIWTGLGWATVQTFAHLPQGWSILYYLARLERSTLERLIAEGVIHPKLRLRQAKALAGLYSGKKVEADAGHPRILARLEKLAQFVEATLPEWSPAQRRSATSKLREILVLIEDHPGTQGARPGEEGFSQ